MKKTRYHICIDCRTPLKLHSNSVATLTMPLNKAHPFDAKPTPEKLQEQPNVLFQESNKEHPVNRITLPIHNGHLHSHRLLVFFSISILIPHLLIRGWIHHPPRVPWENRVKSAPRNRKHRVPPSEEEISLLRFLRRYHPLSKRY